MEPQLTFPNPHVTEVTSDSITIAWDCKIKGVPKDSVHFDIFVKGELADGSSFDRFESPGRESCTITGLKEKTTYSLYVLAVYEDEDIAQRPDTDDGLVVTTLVKDTEAPTVESREMTVSKLTGDGFKIFWEKATDAVTAKKDIRYEVWLKEADSAEDFERIRSAKNIASAQVKKLKEATRYAFYVLAIDEAGNTLRYPGEAVFQVAETLDTVAPTADDKTLSVVGVTHDRISIRWQPAKDNVTARDKIRYMVYWKRDGISDTWSVKRIEPGVFSHEITSLKADTDYSLYVKAIDEAGNVMEYLDAGKPVSVRTERDKETPHADPASLKVTHVTKDSISIQWSPASDNVTAKEKICYEVWWTRNDGQQGTWDSAKLGSYVYSHTITGLSPDTEYAIYVKAIDEAGNAFKYLVGGRYCLETTLDGTAPTADDRTISDTYKDATSVTIQWNPATDKKTAKDKIRYCVYFLPPMDAPDRRWTLVKQDTAFYSYTFTGLKEGTRYSCYVEALDEAGNVLRYPKDSPRHDIVTTTKRVISKNECIVCDGVYKGTADLKIDLGTSSFNRHSFQISCDFMILPKQASSNLHVLTLDYFKNTLSIFLKPAHPVDSSSMQARFPACVSVNNGKQTFAIGTLLSNQWLHLDLRYCNGKLTVNDKVFQVGSLESVLQGNNYLSSQDAIHKTSFRGAIKNLVVTSF